MRYTLACILAFAMLTVGLPIILDPLPRVEFSSAKADNQQATVFDANSAAFQGVVAMTVGTTYAVGRSVEINCTVAGNVSVTFPDASVLVFPVAVGFQTYPFAVTAINSSGTTATATYGNLK